MSMRAPSITEDAKKVAKRASQLAAVLAIVCHLVPPEYRAVCNLIADVCVGRF